MFDEFFGDEPTTDMSVRAARTLGTLSGIALLW
jgi:hypothetical protein